jgi:gas vesicle protein
LDILEVEGDPPPFLDRQENFNRNNQYTFVEGENDMSEHNGDFGAFVAGFLIGGLVGAATALLLAPQSGEETRTLIRDRSIELKDKAVETAEQARHRAETALEDARKRAEIAIEETKHRAEELAQLAKDQGQVILDEGKARLEGIKKAGEDAIDSAKGESEETA